MVDLIDFIAEQLTEFLFEHSWTDKLLGPVYAANYLISYAVSQIELLNEHRIMVTIYVMLFVAGNCLVKDERAKREHYATFVNVNNPNRKYFNAAKVLFWGVFAPLYPAYYIACKSVFLVPAMYVSPFILINVLFFNRDAFYPQLVKTSHLDRYNRSLEA